MKASICFRLVAAAAISCVFAAENVGSKKLGESDSKDAILTGKEVIGSNYNEAESMLNDALREIMQEFSSHVTALHHPLFFSRRRFPSSLTGSRSYSSWDPFSVAGATQSVTRWSPRYEVIDDENSFAIKIDVPSFHFHELDVQLEAGGSVLCVSGTKEEDVNEEWGSKGENDDEVKQPAGEDHEGSIKFTSHTSSSFQQKFTLDPTIDATRMSANLDPEHGTLVIRAPRKKREIEYNKHIPITQVRVIFMLSLQRGSRTCCLISNLYWIFNSIF